LGIRFFTQIKLFSLFSCLGTSGGIITLMVWWFTLNIITNERKKQKYNLQLITCFCFCFCLGYVSGILALSFTLYTFSFQQLKNLIHILLLSIIYFFSLFLWGVFDYHSSRMDELAMHRFLFSHYSPPLDNERELQTIRNWWQNIVTTTNKTTMTTITILKKWTVCIYNIISKAKMLQLIVLLRSFSLAIDILLFFLFWCSSAMSKHKKIESRIEHIKISVRNVENKLISKPVYRMMYKCFEKQKKVNERYTFLKKW
jgi:hypothetical protein